MKMKYTLILLLCPIGTYAFEFQLKKEVENGKPVTAIYSKGERITFYLQTEIDASPTFFDWNALLTHINTRIPLSAPTSSSNKIKFVDESRYELPKPESNIKKKDFPKLPKRTTTMSISSLLNPAPLADNPHFMMGQPQHPIPIYPVATQMPKQPAAPKAFKPSPAMIQQQFISKQLKTPTSMQQPPIIVYAPQQNFFAFQTLPGQSAFLPTRDDVRHL